MYQQLINIKVEKGYLSGPFETIPFSTYRINPLGIAVGKYSGKKRLIVDLSAPHNDSDNPSLNELIDKEEFLLQYVSIDDAIKNIKKLGPGALLMKTDITDAFKIIPLAPEMWPFHCVQWDKKFYYFTKSLAVSRAQRFSILCQQLCAGLSKTITMYLIFFIY